MAAKQAPKEKTYTIQVRYRVTFKDTLDTPKEAVSWCIEDIPCNATDVSVETWEDML